MISEHDQCIFIHIPKTAGQSVEQVFLERAGLTWENREALLLKRNSDSSLGPPRLAHLTAKEYTEYGYISMQKFMSMHKFTVVRNPWDRLVSEFTYQKYSFSFRNFLLKNFPKPGSDDYINHHGHYRHIMPQIEFLTNLDGEICVDSVIKFENIKADFAEVSKAITGQELTLPYRNKTQAPSGLSKLKNRLFKKPERKHYSTYYDDECIAFVAELYAAEIELFKYDFEDLRA
ncbi:sulfotransferase family 2 domain-containing protein [Alteromonas facilis]|uniref:sulfotransferase family 2 domain-containing protein n=1 Tax=Alteromonas facilis TaxID=2048004 RepID=UPI000C286FCA|nr:sulfotransferase family 2 domain-containing protein [Alteromonas facilis]